MVRSDSDADRTPRRSGSACTGVYRSLGDAGGSCSLGRHCLALALVRDHDEYRDAHSRFSDASLPRSTGSSSIDGSTELPRSNQALLDVITDAMDRLDKVNPPRD